jgi:signal transduction histidine kinase
MHSLRLPQHIPLLVQLERILLGLTALAVWLTAVFQPAPRASHIMLLCVMAFALMGLKLPDRRVHKILYIGLEFFLFLLPVLTENRTRFVFILGLVIVLRSGQILHQRDRYFVASLVFSLFILMVILRERSFRLDAEWSVNLIVRYLLDQFHNILAFGLSLTLVLLLTEALLKAQLDQQQLRHYALQVEDHAILQERSRIAHDIHDAIGHTLSDEWIDAAAHRSTASHRFFYPGLSPLRPGFARYPHFRLSFKSQPFRRTAARYCHPIAAAKFSTKHKHNRKLPHLYPVPA